MDTWLGWLFHAEMYRLCRSVSFPLTLACCLFFFFFPPTSPLFTPLLLQSKSHVSKARTPAPQRRQPSQVLSKRSADHLVTTGSQLMVHSYRVLPLFLLNDPHPGISWHLALPWIINPNHDWAKMEHCFRCFSFTVSINSNVVGNVNH